MQRARVDSRSLIPDQPQGLPGIEIEGNVGDGLDPAHGTADENALQDREELGDMVEGQDGLDGWRGRAMAVQPAWASPLSGSMRSGEGLASA